MPFFPQNTLLPNYNDSMAHIFPAYSMAMTRPTRPAAKAALPAPLGTPAAAALSVGVGPAWKPPSSLLPPAAVLEGLLLLSPRFMRVVVGSLVAAGPAEVGVCVLVPYREALRQKVVTSSLAAGARLSLGQLL